MFLNRIYELSLITEEDLETSILKSFPEEVSRKLVQEITEMLLQNRRDMIQLYTTSHIDWVQQVLGYGFSLDLHQAHIIESCIMIYSQWLLETHTRPVYFTDNTPLSSASQLAINQPQINTEVKKKYEQKFLQRCFLHLSQIFHFKEPLGNVEDLLKGNLSNNGNFNLNTSDLNSSSTGLIQRFIDLCKHVSALYASIGRSIGHQLSEQSWHILLKCILGITDQILRLNITASPFHTFNSLENQDMESINRMESISNSNNIHMEHNNNSNTLQSKLSLIADVLCDSILRTLFELWLRSEVHDGLLWDRFEECFNHWSHRPNVIQHWIVILESLASRLVYILYDTGAKLGTQEVIINQLGYNIKLKLSNDTVYFLFYKVMYLLEPNISISNKCWDIIIKGMNKIYIILTEIQPIKLNNNQKQNNISGNSILRLIGQWLFLNIQQIKEKSNEVQFNLYKLLCQLFSIRNISTFSKEYKNEFIKLVQFGLDYDVILQAILIYSSKLFCSIHAAELLLPSYLISIKQIVPTLKPGFKLIEPIDIIRNGILKLIEPALILPYKYPYLKLPEDFKLQLNLPKIFDSILQDIKEEEKQEFSYLKYYLIQLIYQFLLSETEATNFQLSLNHMLLLISNDIQNHQKLIIIFLKICIQHIIKIHLSEDMVIHCFNSLKDLLLQMKFSNNEKEEDNEELILITKQLLIRVSEFILELLNQDNLVLNYKSIISAYDLLCYYVLKLSKYNLINNNDDNHNELFIQQLFTIINYGLNIQYSINKINKYEVENNDYNLIKQKIHLLSQQLFYYCFNINEDNEMNENDSYFSLNNCLLQLKVYQNHQLIIIIRNPFNKVAFSLKRVKVLELKKGTPILSPIFNKTIALKSPNVPIQTPNFDFNRMSKISIIEKEVKEVKEENRISQSESSITDIQQDNFIKFQQLIELQKQNEMNYIQHNTQYQHQKESKIQLENQLKQEYNSNSQNNNNNKLIIRQWLIEMGLIDLFSKESIQPIKFNNLKNWLLELNQLNQFNCKLVLFYSNDIVSWDHLILPNLDAIPTHFTKLLKALVNKNDNGHYHYIDETLKMIIECPYLDNSLLKRTFNQLKVEQREEELIEEYQKQIMDFNVLLIVIEDSKTDIESIWKYLKLKDGMLLFCFYPLENGMVKVTTMCEDRKEYRNNNERMMLYPLKKEQKMEGYYILPLILATIKNFNEQTNFLQLINQRKQLFDQLNQLQLNETMNLSNYFLTLLNE
ncbi:hypothetical protein K502DRAFT_361842 [Neoconidiobolus thromboides FSU 785]|nr:hypothetical protein K502DRAFT_361842 [Neoconidiobolus thromboides FSU 785]